VAQKALQREDLIRILEAIFKISRNENNAFKMLTDGLYVEDYHNDLNEHTTNDNIHVDINDKELLSKFSVSESGSLMYDGLFVGITLSNEENNGIVIKGDGLYVPDPKGHLEDEDIHVTKQDKETWNKTLQEAKDYVTEEINKLVIGDVQIVPALPQIPVIDDTLIDENGNPVEPVKVDLPSSTTLYLLANDPDCPEECSFIPYMFLQDKWVKLISTNLTFKKFALKTEVKDAIDNSHTHDNKEILDKFNLDNNGELEYNGTNIHDIDISNEPGNAAKMIDGKLFVQDFSNEIKSIETSSAWGKTILCTQEIMDSGIFYLKDVIDNYNLLLIEYYYKPSDTSNIAGCAKTAIVDTDILNFLFERSMHYILDYGYGALTSSSKIRIKEDKMWVDYCHDICIYQITGIRRGDSDE
jgi:hypothetical protein